MKKIFAFAFSSLFIISCSKDDKVDDNPADLKGTVEIKFEHVWGPNAAPFALNQELTHPSGQKMTFTTLRYYISNIRLKKADGTEWVQPESYYIVDAAQTPEAKISIAEVPAGDYVEISFLIGVDSLRNTSGAQVGALSPEHGMFWSWNTGYIFIKAEGNSPDSPTGTFVYHIGGFSGMHNAIRDRTISFNGGRLMVKPNAVPSIHLMVNAARFWHGGVQLSQVHKVHMPGANASMLATNFQGAITFDHLHN
ncbi:MAG: MbnP family protein [Thermaurantimonas sp.]